MTSRNADVLFPFYGLVCWCLWWMMFIMHYHSHKNINNYHRIALMFLMMVIIITRHGIMSSHSWMVSGWCNGWLMDGTMDGRTESNLVDCEWLLMMGFLSIDDGDSIYAENDGWYCWSPIGHRCSDSMTGLCSHYPPLTIITHNHHFQPPKWPAELQTQERMAPSHVSCGSRERFQTWRPGHMGCAREDGSTTRVDGGS